MQAVTMRLGGEVRRWAWMSAYILHHSTYPSTSMVSNCMALNDIPTPTANPHGHVV